MYSVSYSSYSLFKDVLKFSQGFRRLLYGTESVRVFRFLFGSSMEGLGFRASAVFLQCCGGRV